MKYSERHKILKQDGWLIIRQKGSHVIMEHPLKDGQLVVPFHSSKEVKKGLVSGLLKQAKINTPKR